MSEMSQKLRAHYKILDKENSSESLNTLVPASFFRKAIPNQNLYRGLMTVCLLGKGRARRASNSSERYPTTGQALRRDRREE
jgi:hypothetical protein